jgi:hypothetical protein
VLEPLIDELRVRWRSVDRIENQRVHALSHASFVTVQSPATLNEIPLIFAAVKKCGYAALIGMAND